MGRCDGPSGEALVVIAALVSLQIAEGKSADQLDLIAAFFSVLGDNLALIAVRRPTAGGGEGTAAQDSGDDRAHQGAGI